MEEEKTVKVTVCDDCGMEDHFSMVKCTVCKKDYCGICVANYPLIRGNSRPDIRDKWKNFDVVGKCCDPFMKELGISTSIEPGPDVT